MGALSLFKGQAKDSFITQDRDEDFMGRQVESTFSQGHCDQTSGTISKIGAKNERYRYYLSINAT